MDRQAVRAVVASVAARRRGSRLEPYVALIRALRRRGCSYREIVAVLHERCGLRVGLHTLYHFVRTRVRTPAQASGRRRQVPSARSSATEHGAMAPIAVVDDTIVRARIAALKQPTATIAPNKEFRYDDNEPLQLVAERKPVKR